MHFVFKFNQAAKYLTQRREVVDICLKFAKIHGKVEPILLKCTTLLFITIKSFTKTEVNLTLTLFKCSHLSLPFQFSA
jgi:hypothetical protein